MPMVRQQLNQFFIDVQKRTLAHIEFSIGHRDDALDLLQEAMLKLAKNYANQSADWPMLFQRIVYNLIIDYQRKKKVRRVLVWWQQRSDESDDNEYTQAESALNKMQKPEQITSQMQILKALELQLGLLPERQRQVFSLRAWFGHNVKETAFIMGCSEGSVKTHYSRAIAQLRRNLDGFTFEECI